MARLDVMDTIKKGRSVINDRYDLRLCDVKEIENNSSNYIKMAVNMFYFGYMQGVKATQAKTKSEKGK